MAYRFATTLGLAGLLAQTVVAAPVALPNNVVVEQAPAVTQVVTVTAGGAPAPTANAGNVAKAPAPVAAAPSAPVVAQSPSKAVSSASAPAPSSSSSTSTTSQSGQPGRGVCVDGTMGPAGLSLAKDVITANPGKLNWYTNWASTGSDIGNTKFYPMLKSQGMPWSPKGDVALSYNEADFNMPGGGSAACSAWKSEYLPPVKAANMKVTTPSFTSSDSTSNPNVGLGWLKSFWSSCGSSEQVDYVTPHYYFYPSKDPVNNTPESFINGGAPFKAFTDFITQAHTITGKPVLITELGLDPDTPGKWSNEQMGAFFATAESWLSKQSFVAGWGAFEIGQQAGQMNTAGGSSIVSKYLS